MTKTASILAVPAVALLAAAAFAQSAGLQVREAMIEGVNPAALAIWEVTNAAMDDQGALDPAVMDEEAWSKVAEAARQLQFHSRRMAEAEAIVAGGPDLVSGELPPGVASREEIQAMIDADPAGFRAVAAEMAEQSGALLAAARARDPEAAGDLAFGIDAACQSCHVRYWYLQAE